MCHEKALLPFHKSTELWAKRGLGRLCQRAMDLAHLYPIAGRHPSSLFHELSFHQDLVQSIPKPSCQTFQCPAPSSHICEATADRQNNFIIFLLQAAPEGLKTTPTFPCSRLKPSSFPFSSLPWAERGTRAWDTRGSLQDFLQAVPIFVEVHCPESDTKHCCWTVLNVMIYWTDMQDFPNQWAWVLLPDSITCSYKQVSVSREKLFISSLRTINHTFEGSLYCL